MFNQIKSERSLSVRKHRLGWLIIALLVDLASSGCVTTIHAQDTQTEMPSDSVVLPLPSTSKTAASSGIAITRVPGQGQPTSKQNEAPPSQGSANGLLERRDAFWGGIKSIIKDYHYYVTPDQLEKIFNIKITDREIYKDKRSISRYEKKEIVYPGTYILSLQLENFEPTSLTPLWQQFRDNHGEKAWLSILDIGDLSVCKPLSDVENDLEDLGMKKEAELNKLYGVMATKYSVFIDPRYDAEVTLYYNTPAVTWSCVESIRIMGLGHLKIK